MEKKIIVLGSILAASAVTIALCVMGKNKEEEKSNFRSKSKDKNKTKVCNCAYLGKPNKTCSADVHCNPCCEGAGNTGQEFVTASNASVLNK